MTDRKESPSKESAAGPATAITSDEQEEKFRCSFCAQIFASRKDVNDGHKRLFLHCIKIVSGQVP